MESFVSRQTFSSVTTLSQCRTKSYAGIISAPHEIKTNATQSLVVNQESGDATFISKANPRDITDPDNPISIAGNLGLIITLTDAGEPAIADSIGITLWNRDELWFSSRWTGVKTEEELLNGGNLVIH